MKKDKTILIEILITLIIIINKCEECKIIIFKSL